MKITNYNANAAVLKELGRRFEEVRLSRNISQSDMAERSGVSLSTLSRFERGMSVQLDSFVSLLKGIRLAENLDLLIAEDSVSPIQLLRNSGKPKRRSSKVGVTDGTPWKWGDEK